MGTNDYYKENAKSFILDTMNADMSEQYQNFLKFMPKKGKILDVDPEGIPYIFRIWDMIV